MKPVNKNYYPEFAQLLANGNLSVKTAGTSEDGEHWDGDEEIRPQHPLFAEWLVIARKSQHSRELMFAAESGDVFKLNALLAEGIDVNAADERGRTALFRAVQLGHLEVVKVLLNAGADVHIKSTKGKSVFDVTSANIPEIADLLNKANRNH